jgi:hypothetical protein
VEESVTVAEDIIVFFSLQEKKKKILEAKIIYFM